MEPITEERFKQFFDKLLSDQFRFEFDLQLPFSIIKSFWTVWELWLTYPSLNAALKNFDLYYIYNSMESFFRNQVYLDFMLVTPLLEPITEEKLNQLRDKLANQAAIDDDDLELASSVIKTFSKLWELWVKMPQLRTAVDHHEFLDIHFHLAAYFKKNPDYLYFNPELEGLDEFYDWVQRKGAAPVDEERRWSVDGTRATSVRDCSLDNVVINYENDDVNDHDDDDEVDERQRQRQQQQQRLPTRIINHLKDMLTIQKNANVTETAMRYCLATKLRNEQPQVPETACDGTSEADTFDAFIRELPYGAKMRKYCLACACYISSVKSLIIRHIHGERHRSSIDSMGTEAAASAQRRHAKSLRNASGIDRILWTWALFIGETDTVLNLRYCSTCNQYVHPEVFDVSRHVKSIMHWDNMIRMIEAETSKMKMDPWNSDPFFGEVDRRGRRYCSACYCRVSATETDLKVHFNSSCHQNRSRLKIQQFDYSLFIDAADWTARRYCRICCCYVSPSVSSVAEHVQHFIHQVKVQQLNTAAYAPFMWNPTNPIGYPYIENFNDRGFLFCSICACLLTASEIEVIRHVNTPHHKFQIEQCKEIPQCQIN